MAKRKQNKKGKNQTTRNFNESQTASVLETGRVITDHPSNKITPAKLKSIFEDAEGGDLQAQHELFMDIEERDSAIAANIQTRKRAILTLDWRIVAPRNATASDEALREEIEGFFYQFTGLEDLLIDMMDAVGHGFSALEIEWQLIEGKWQPKALYHRPQSWFKTDNYDNLLIKTPDNQMGEPLLPFNWLIHRHKSRSSQLARMGLYRTLAWLYLFKHYSVHDFAEFLELYGMPIRIGKYGAGATAEEKRTLLRALAQIGHNAAGIMPDSMQIELHNAANGVNVSSNPFLQMVEWCEKSAAKMILGQTLTSGADGKSSTNALGNIHNEVRRDLLVSDAKQVAQSITQQLILYYLQINHNPNIDPNRIPYFEFDTKERDDLKEYAEALPKLVSIGVTIPQSWVQEKLGIPEPQEGEAILKAVQTDFKGELNNDEAEDKTGKKRTALTFSHRTGCGCGCGKTALSTQKESQNEQQILDTENDKALAHPDFNQQLSPMVQQAVAVLQACHSYEQAFERLTTLYPELDSNEHERYLTQALFVAELLGESNVRR